MSSSCCKNKKSDKNLEEVIEFLKVISEKNRLKILCVLKKEEMCVCDIWSCLDLPQNLTSHHLKVLKDFNLVDSRKEGTKVIYSINSQKIDRCALLLSHYINTSA